MQAEGDRIIYSFHAIYHKYTMHLISEYVSFISGYAVPSCVPTGDEDKRVYFATKENREGRRLGLVVVTNVGQHRCSKSRLRNPRGNVELATRTHGLHRAPFPQSLGGFHATRERYKAAGCTKRIGLGTPCTGMRFEVHIQLSLVAKKREPTKGSSTNTNAASGFGTAGCLPALLLVGTERKDRQHRSILFLYRWSCATSSSTAWSGVICRQTIRKDETNTF